MSDKKKLTRKQIRLLGKHISVHYFGYWQGSYTDTDNRDLIAELINYWSAYEVDGFASQEDGYFSMIQLRNRGAAEGPLQIARDLRPEDISLVFAEAQRQFARVEKFLGIENL